MKNQRKPLGSLLSSGAVLLTTAAAAHAQGIGMYNLTDLGVVNSSATGTAQTTSAAGVNSLGQVAGISVIPYTYTTSGGTVVNTTYQNAFDTSANGAGYNNLGAGTGTPNATSGLPPTSNAYSINDSGVLVGRTSTTGTYNDPTYGALNYTNINHAYRLNSNTQSAITSANDLGTLTQPAYRTSTGGTGSNASQAMAVNASGQITGASQVNVNGGAAGFSFHVFRINANETTLTPADDLGVISSNGSSYGTAISSLGQVTGYGTPAVSTSQTHAFRLGLNETSLSAADDIGTLGSNTFQGTTYNNSFAYGINTSGQVVGTSTTTVTGQMHAFRSSANGSALSLLDLGSLPGQLSIASGALGIDTAGDVVGYDTLNSSINHAFFYSNATATMYDLNSYLASNPNSALLNVAYGITDNGNIVAYGTQNNAVHAFLLTPAIGSAATPEPTAIALLLSGLAAGSSVLTRRRARKSTAA